MASSIPTEYKWFLTNLLNLLMGPSQVLPIGEELGVMEINV